MNSLLRGNDIGESENDKYRGSRTLREKEDRLFFKSSPLFLLFAGMTCKKLFILVTYQNLYYPPQPGEGLVTTTETVSVWVILSSV